MCKHTKVANGLIEFLNGCTMVGVPVLDLVVSGMEERGLPTDWDWDDLDAHSPALYVRTDEPEHPAITSARRFSEDVAKHREPQPKKPSPVVGDKQ